MEKLLLESFPEAQIMVHDLTGSGDHFDLRIAAREFVGKTKLQQHQMVYSALGSALDGPIHAIQINTTALDEQ